MKRAVLVVLSVLVLLSVATDPYTFRRTAGDYVEWAPWWQLSLGVLNLLLLCVLLVLVWRGRTWRASQVLAVETLYNLGVALALLHRDGLTRFIQGIGAEEYLSLYLLSIALRVILLVALAQQGGFLRSPLLEGTRPHVQSSSDEVRPT